MSEEREHITIRISDDVKESFMKNNMGLVSISFREKCVNEIIKLCSEAGLTYIEWGGDVHCPTGDTERAREISVLTKNAGLIPYCYGSYFRFGLNGTDEFISVCRSACALGAKTVRIWGYNKSFAACTDNEIEKLRADARVISDIAREYGLYINFEYHRGCLTETADGALKLFAMFDEDILRVHWQPNPEITVEENLRELSMLPRVDIVHVFAWTFEDGENVRHPLYNHHLTWQEYVALAKSKNSDCVFELEFFKGDSGEQLLEDAETLKSILKSVL